MGVMDDDVDDDELLTLILPLLVLSSGSWSVRLEEIWMRWFNCFCNLTSTFWGAGDDDVVVLVLVVVVVFMVTAEQMDVASGDQWMVAVAVDTSA